MDGSAVRSKVADSQTAFQQLLVERANLAANWLVRSIEVNRGQGSSAFYSRVYRPLGGWAAPYPETTGYLIPTLLGYTEFALRPDLKPVILESANWLTSLQYPDGAFPGGLVKNGKRGGPSVFNTAQIIKGLLAADTIYPRTADYLERAVRAAWWLANNIDAKDGIWNVHAYREGYVPAYYTQVCWPMLAVARRTGDVRLRDHAVSALDTIAGWQLPNGAVKNWAFGPGQPAFTHTIAYTLRGFIESADLLEPGGERFRSIAEKAAAAIRRRTDIRGSLAGAYSEDLKGIYWYSCLTGHCQMALVWMKLYRATGDARYLNTALKVLQYAVERQKLHGPMRGAIAGSSPIWGRYLTFRYPNWATKYLLDAIMLAHSEIERVRVAGPCA